MNENIRDDVEPQKSEIHRTTGDASTSPDAIDDTPHLGQPHPNMPHDDTGKVPVKALDPDTVILIDDTDVGGPLVIVSSDPDLNPPHVAQDPFPTLGVPEIDPAV